MQAISSLGFVHRTTLILSRFKVSITTQELSFIWDDLSNFLVVKAHDSSYYKENTLREIRNYPQIPISRISRIPHESKNQLVVFPN